VARGDPRARGRRHDRERISDDFAARGASADQARAAPGKSGGPTRRDDEDMRRAGEEDLCRSAGEAHAGPDVLSRWDGEEGNDLAADGEGLRVAAVGECKHAHTREALRERRELALRVEERGVAVVAPGQEPRAV